MNDFFKYVEDWCSIYKPMLHSEENQRFFLTESYSGFMDFMRGIDAQTEGPMVVMETMTGGSLTKWDEEEYVIYFFSKAEIQGDGREAKKAARDALSHLFNFVFYLRDDIKKTGPSHPFAKMNLESIRYQAVGPLYDHWYGYYLTVEDIQMVDHCPDESLYIKKRRKR